MIKIKDHYNKGHDDYYQNLGLKKSSLLQREIKSLKIIKKNIKENMRFLDIGCGNGQFLQHIRQNFNTMKLQLFGVDNSDHQINMAKQKHNHINFIKANSEDELPFQKNSFDIIYAGELIEHLYDPDRFIKNCLKILKKDGLLILTTPNLCSWYNRIFFLFGIIPQFYELSVISSEYGRGLLKKIQKSTLPVGHIRVFNYFGLRDLLSTYELQITYFYGSTFEINFNFLYYILDNFFATFPQLSSTLIVSAKNTSD